MSASPSSVCSSKKSRSSSCALSVANEPICFDGLIDGTPKQSYARLLDICPTFRDDAEYFLGHDSVLGPVLVAIAIDRDDVAGAFVLTGLGPKAVWPMGAQVKQRFSHSIAGLPVTLQTQPLFCVIAIALAFYFDHLPATSRNYGNDEGQGAASLDINGQTISNIVGSMVAVRKTQSVKNTLLEYIESRATPYASFRMLYSDSQQHDPALEKVIQMFSDTRRRDRRKSSIGGQAQTAEYDSERVECLLEELQATERNYVNRLAHLVEDYATPLKEMARRSKAQGSLYEMNCLFPSSLSDILAANKSFLRELELTPEPEDALEACRTHFEAFRTPYQRYLEQSISFEQLLRSCNLSKKAKKICDAAKHKSRFPVSLRELVMEPVQRIPRYAVILESMCKPSAIVTKIEDIKSSAKAQSSMNETCRTALKVIRNIAQMSHAEADDRSVTFFNINTLVTSFPASLVSNSRTLLGALDVQETLMGVGSLTLLLFNDCLCFVRRKRDIDLAKQITSTDVQAPAGINSSVSSRSLSFFRDRQGTFLEHKSLDSFRVYRSDTECALWLAGSATDLLGMPELRLMPGKSQSTDDFYKSICRAQARSQYPQGVLSETCKEPRTFFVAHQTYSEARAIDFAENELVLMLDPPDDFLTNTNESAKNAVFLICQHLDGDVLSLSNENNIGIPQPSKCFVESERLTEILDHEVLKVLSAMYSPQSSCNECFQSRTQAAILNRIADLESENRWQLSGQSSPVKLLQNILGTPQEARPFVSRASNSSLKEELGRTLVPSTDAEVLSSVHFFHQQVIAIEGDLEWAPVANPVEYRHAMNHYKDFLRQSHCGGATPCLPKCSLLPVFLIFVKKAIRPKQSFFLAPAEGQISKTAPTVFESFSRTMRVITARLDDNSREEFVAQALKNLQVSDAQTIRQLRQNWILLFDKALPTPLPKDRDSVLGKLPGHSSLTSLSEMITERSSPPKVRARVPRSNCEVELKAIMDNGKKLQKEQNSFQVLEAEYQTDVLESEPLSEHSNTLRRDNSLKELDVKSVVNCDSSHERTNSENQRVWFSPSKPSPNRRLEFETKPKNIRRSFRMTNTQTSLDIEPRQATNDLFESLRLEIEVLYDTINSELELLSTDEHNRSVLQSLYAEQGKLKRRLLEQSREIQHLKSVS